MRILLALLLTLAALVAAAPATSAVAICSNQVDARDLALGNQPAAQVSCTTENLISYDCDATVTADYDGSVSRSVRCEPLIYCVTEPCPGPVALSAAADPLAAAPCSNDLNPTDDNGVSVSCTAAGMTCSAGALAFGPWPGSLLWGPSCTGKLQPPYDCVQDCDGPPTE